jgi:hypothetical protein
MPTIPSVTTQAASSITASTVILHGLLGYDGGEACDIRFGFGMVSSLSVAGYSNQSAWINNTYTTSQTIQLYLNGLAPGTYYYRIQGANTFGDVTGAELSFSTTAGTMTAPTSFVATTSGTSVLLSWLKGYGSTDTYIKFQTGSYPAAVGDGALVYSGAFTTYTQPGLTSGTTYYFSAWAKLGPIYSTNHATALVTIPASYTPPVPVYNTTAPPSYYQNTTSANFTENPVEPAVVKVAGAYGMPEATIWFILAMFLSMAAGVWIYSISFNIMLAMGATGAGIGFSVAMGLVPGWILIAYLVFAISTIVITTRYGG